MFKFLFHILVYIEYPNQDIESMQKYNEGIEYGFQKYCFLDVTYETVKDRNKADLIIYPEYIMSDYSDLGLCTSSFTKNKKMYDIPEIYISVILFGDAWKTVFTHELGHFFGLPHSIDTKSLMYHSYNPDAKLLSRQDSLILYTIYGIKP